MKILIIYYSRTGTTKKAAEILSQNLGAELEAVADTVNRKGILGYLRCGREAMKKIMPEILPLKNNPADYDLVVIGTPNWAANMASPIRALLEKHKSQIKRSAFFCVQGGSGSQKALKEMADLLGQPPVAELVLRTKEVVAGQAEEKINDFAQKLN